MQKNLRSYNQYAKYLQYSTGICTVRSICYYEYLFTSCVFPEYFRFPQKIRFLTIIVLDSLAALHLEVKIIKVRRKRKKNRKIKQ